MFSIALLQFRSTLWFTTFVVGFSIATDIFAYAVIIPFIPFRLEALGFKDPSSHSGWLLFAYSAGLVISTIPIAHFSEIQKSRRVPFLFGTFILIGSQILFMLAPLYSLLIVARVFQGVGSAIVWTVGLALICDVAPQDRVGQQLGIALTGLSIGFVLSPPIGGILYQKHGFRAPILFSIGLCLVDLLGRLLVIEPTTSQQKSHSTGTTGTNKTPVESNPQITADNLMEPEKNSVDPVVQTPASSPNPLCQKSSNFPPDERSPSVFTLSRVLLAILRSRRSCVASIIALCIGIHLSAQEPTLSLRLNNVYGFNSGQIGLVYIASGVPSIFAAPLGGYLSDRRRPDLIILVFSSFALPWIVLMALRGPLALFIVSYVMTVFFSSAILTPTSVELAAVTRATPEIGFSYQYGIFNIAYGIGSSLGPLIASQLYDHAKHGWTSIISLSSGLVMITALLTFLLAGEIPYARSLIFSKFDRTPAS